VRGVGRRYRPALKAFGEVAHHPTFWKSDCPSKMWRSGGTARGPLAHYRVSPFTCWLAVATSRVSGSAPTASPAGFSVLAEAEASACHCPVPPDPCATLCWFCKQPPEDDLSGEGFTGASGCARPSRRGGVRRLKRRRTSSVTGEGVVSRVARCAPLCYAARVMSLSCSCCLSDF
jgi:hypothetical protein